MISNNMQGYVVESVWLKQQKGNGMEVSLMDADYLLVVVRLDIQLV